MPRGTINEIPKHVESAIHEHIGYNPHTGEFFWKKPGRGRSRSGKCGSLTPVGYVQIMLTVEGQEFNFLGHRLAWFMHHGTWPVDYIDHINQVKDDNRIVNLRQATTKQNVANRSKYLTYTQSNIETITHGVYVGVDRMKSGRWRAICGRKYLGTFATAEEAALAYNKKAKELYGDFAHQNVVDTAHES